MSWPRLDLYGTKISDTGVACLKGLTKLTKLNLLGAALTDAGLEQLAGLTYLEELNLYRTRITNASVETLKRFRKLRDLDLRYTRVTRGGVAALNAALPIVASRLDTGSTGPKNISKLCLAIRRSDRRLGTGAAARRRRWQAGSPKSVSPRHPCRRGDARSPLPRTGKSWTSATESVTRDLPSAASCATRTEAG
jgi:hypothetical protein